MPDFSINSPLKCGPVFPEWVWYIGVDAIKEGQGVQRDSIDVATPVGAATVADARRWTRVKVCASGGLFAGVAAADYPASPTGQLIQIYGPGSVCMVLTYNITTVVGSNTQLVCSYDATATTGSWAGTFKLNSASGKGGAYALQTITGSSAFQKVLAYLETGPVQALCA
jgi:hypothetical protein